MKGRKKTGSFAGVLGTIEKNDKGVTDYLLKIPSGVILLVNKEDITIEKEKPKEA